MALTARTAPPPASKDYNSEFGNLGPEAVRKELLLRRWQPEKLAAARIWVESRDTHSWVAGRGDTPAGDKKKAFRKYAVIIAAGFGLCYVAARVFNSLF
jgi:hypothetical protein